MTMEPRTSSSSSSKSGSEFQLLWGSLTNQFHRFSDDPRVERLMNTRVVQYLSSHPVLSLSVLLFSAMAALPLGLFLVFALVTIIMTAVGFVFFELFLLFVAGMTLLSVLTGIAFFSIVASFIFNAFYITLAKILSSYYPHLTKQRKNQEDSEFETSNLEDTQ